MCVTVFASFTYLLDIQRQIPKCTVPLLPLNRAFVAGFGGPASRGIVELSEDRCV